MADSIARTRWAPDGRTTLRVTLWLAVSALIFWSLRGSEFSGRLLWEGVPQIFKFFGRMAPPNWSVWDVLVRASVETLQTTIAGTFLGAVVAYPLGVLAASTLTPGWVHLPIKAFMALIRSIPLLLLALLFVSAVGLGPFPGVLAIAGGAYWKAIVITRAGHFQGFALAKYPGRGSGRLAAPLSLN